MDGGPEGLAEGGSAVGIFGFERGAAGQEQIDRIQCPPITAQCRAVWPVLAWACERDAALEEEIRLPRCDRIRRPRGRRVPSALGWIADGAGAGLIEKAFDYVEAAEAGGGFEIQVAPRGCEKFGGLDAAVGEAER